MTNEESDELWRKYEITKEVFERPLEMTKHEDEKAGRILASMAFLTVAAATSFAAFLNKGVKFEILLYSTQVVDLIPVSFLIYVIFATVGTVLMLEAFGPSFEIPKMWSPAREGQKNNTVNEYEPPSLFFFEKIAPERDNQWLNYFDSKVGGILTKACKDHVFEAHLVSTKVRKKVRYIKWGKRLFYLAMFMLCVLVLVGSYAYSVR
jgi:hypothetical protein